MISLTSAEAAPGFDDPLQMLRACHGKILRQCGTLRKLADHLDNGNMEKSSPDDETRHARSLSPTLSRLAGEGTNESLRELHINHGCDAQVQQAAQGILRYFDTAGQFHHQDEEENLFPALRNCPDVDAALLERLLSDHQVLLASWNALRPVLAQLAEGQDVTLAAALVEKFIASYTAHINVENTQLLPMAARLLSPQQQDSLGRKMSERRGAKFPAPATD
ncbi:MAG: hemerythrin domain-containing protein [Gallionella sp.]|jgi:hemerythrin-like domain-containing protein